MTEKEWLGEENQLGMDIWIENTRTRGKALKNGSQELPGAMRKWPAISGRKVPLRRMDPV